MGAGRRQDVFTIYHLLTICRAGALFNHGLLNQCHDVSGVQFFIDKQVASGSVMFGHTNTMNGPEWVAAFTNAVQIGEVQSWDPNKKNFRHESPRLHSRRQKRLSGPAEKSRGSISRRMNLRQCKLLNDRCSMFD
jgi:hypothetical protein